MNTLPTFLRIVTTLFAAFLFAASLLGADAAASLTEKLALARTELAQMNERYSDKHPVVIEQRAKITALEKEIAALEAAADAQKVSSDEGKQLEQFYRQMTFNVDFPGGTLAQLANAVRPHGGVVFNLVGEKTDLATEVPALSLRNVNTESFANALDRLLLPRGLEISRAPGPNWGRYDFVHQPVYVVTKRPVRPDPNGFVSFQLTPYLKHQSIDDIVGAVRTAWELDPQHLPSELQLKFHPPTGILLASGSPAALNVARQVISTLWHSEPKSAGLPTPAPTKR